MIPTAEIGCFLINRTGRDREAPGLARVPLVAGILGGTVFALIAPGVNWKHVMEIINLRRRDSEAGRSIIEIVVVVMVAGIVSATAVVMFAKGKQRYELSQRAQNISRQIERARSLAVKYNQTLTLGFTSENSVFGITCTTCTEPKSELPSLRIPAGITLSTYPTITIKGNGTISASSQTIVVSDGRGSQVPITISNSGRTQVGDVSEGT